MYVVTIFGAAGSGKSVLAGSVAEWLGADVAARVPTDYFFVPRQPDEPLETFLTKPLAWDWELLETRLAVPVGTDTSTPDADFASFTRIASTGGRTLPIRPVMIVDAMAPYPNAHLAVRLNVPEEVRRERIVSRDRRWGTRVQDRWAQLEATWQAVSGDVPDCVVVDGTRPLERIVAALGEVIRDGARRERQGGR